MGETTKAARITREARLYALKELSRRAGITTETFRSWKIEFGGEEASVYIHPGTEKRIRFTNAPSTFSSEGSARTFHTVRASWMYPPPEALKILIPDFVIPFSQKAELGGCPLFRPVDRDTVECGLDLLASILLSLSRWEETLPTERDVHGRFPASMSLAFRDGFLIRPVVDEYGLAFEQALNYLLSGWRPTERKLRVKLSHDVDEVGLPFSLTSAVGHTVRRHKFLATAQDLVAWLPGVNPAYLEAVRQIVQLSLDRGLDSAVYWKASPPGPMDSGYDPRHPKVQRVIFWMHKRGVETGVHPGYDTFLSPERLSLEVQVLREVLGKRLLGGRQHYLRWCPKSWQHWEDCGLAYDSSVGYADHVGFRAGTCLPYRPWLLSLNREARLMEIPLIAMDVTLRGYMGLTGQQSFEPVLECLRRCSVVGGVFTLLWHNSSLIDPVGADFYRTIIDRLAGSGRFDGYGALNEVY